MHRYRIVEGYDDFFNMRYEVQQKHFYNDVHGNTKFRWVLLFCSAREEECERVLDKYLSKSKLYH